jgi:hypothetical protein
MTYTAGGDISATDYNVFSVSVNTIYSDNNLDSTTLPQAGFGYGITPPIATVAPQTNVLASQWADLFSVIRRLGTHQGTSVSPPVPVTDPVPLTNVIAFNTPSIAGVISDTNVNRFNLALGQSALVTGTTFTNPTTWTNTLTWTVSVDFGSWNNARYFFNSGGTLNLSGSYSSSPVNQADIEWRNMLIQMSPLVFAYNSTTPAVSGGGTLIGFYGLTTSYQTVYFRINGAGYYYANSSVTVQARYASSAGISGIVEFRIILTDADINDPNPKPIPINFRADHRRSAGAIVYPGTVTVTNAGFVAT